MPDTSRLGVTLRHARERLNLTQAVLADRVGIAPNHLLRLETGEKSNPRFETIARLAAELGLSLDELSELCGYRHRTSAAPRDRTILVKAAHDLAPLSDMLEDASKKISSVLSNLRAEAGSATPPQKPKSTARRKR